MASVPLAARLVEVIADRGSRKEALPVRVGVHRGRAGGADRGPRGGGGAAASGAGPTKGGVLGPVDPSFVGDANGPGPDLALVEID